MSKKSLHRFSSFSPWPADQRARTIARGQPPLSAANFMPGCEKMGASKLNEHYLVLTIGGGRGVMLELRVPGHYVFRVEKSELTTSQSGRKALAGTERGETRRDVAFFQSG